MADELAHYRAVQCYDPGLRAGRASVRPHGWIRDSCNRPLGDLCISQLPDHSLRKRPRLRLVRLLQAKGRVDHDQLPVQHEGRLDPSSEDARSLMKPPNKRLKLAARVDCGMNSSSARRSLSAIR